LTNFFRHVVEDVPPTNSSRKKKTRLDVVAAGRSSTKIEAVAKTLPKNLIADPPCKVTTGKGFGGTCPLALLCAQYYEMEISFVAAELLVLF
jgi:hypothetical protein